MKGRNIVNVQKKGELGWTTEGMLVKKGRQEKGRGRRAVKLECLGIKYIGVRLRVSFHQSTCIFKRFNDRKEKGGKKRGGSVTIGRER